MSRRGRAGLEGAVVTSLALLVAACGPIPDIVDDVNAPPPAVEPSCHEGRDGTIEVTFCEVTDPALLLKFRADRWLPPRVRALRLKSPLRYGGDLAVGIDRPSARAKLHDSYMIAHYDLQRAISGWDIFDAERHLAILSLDLDDHWVLVYADANATNAALVRASLRRFLDAPEPIAVRAQKLYPR